MITLANFEKNFSENAMGYSALGIIVSTCLGSVAIMQTLTFGHELFQMFIVMISVVICSAHNAAILTVQKPAIIFRLLVTSIAINSLVIFTSLFL